ncbi:MAG: branched-chain amino acid ABC transporter permease [Chloroflexia bacterium]
MSQFFATYGELIVNMALMATLALSLYLPLMAGQLSLASPGFYALGGYIGAVLSTNPHSPLAGFFPKTGELYSVWLVLAEMAVAALVCAVLGVIVGLPALRLRGIYLALATIAFVEILRVLSLNVDITGGAVGIYNIPQPFNDPSQLSYLWIAGPLLLLSMLFVGRLERIRVGRAFVAIREDELAAGAMGINPTYYKVLAFTMGAVLAGLVGVISAHLINTWNARQGTFDLSILILAFALIGGSRTFLGPVLGGLVLTALPEVLRSLAGNTGMAEGLVQFLKDGRLIIYGFLLVIGTVFLPQGFVSPALLSRLAARRSKTGPRL